jgi:hypothetical protein
VILPVTDKLPESVKEEITAFSASFTILKFPFITWISLVGADAPFPASFIA